VPVLVYGDGRRHLLLSGWVTQQRAARGLPTEPAVHKMLDMRRRASVTRSKSPMKGVTDDTLDVPAASARRTTQPTPFVDSACSGTGCTESTTCHAVELATHLHARRAHGRHVAAPDRRTVHPTRAASTGWRNALLAPVAAPAPRTSDDPTGIKKSATFRGARSAALPAMGGCPGRYVSASSHSAARHLRCPIGEEAPAELAVGR
jgi:hypothetical protein